MQYTDIIARARALEKLTGGSSFKWDDGFSSETMGLWDKLAVDKEPPSFTEAEFRVVYLIETEKLIPLAAKAALLNKFIKDMKPITGLVTQLEVNTFMIQRLEANYYNDMYGTPEYSSDNVQNIQALASARNIPLFDLVVKILKKAKAYKVVFTRMGELHKQQDLLKEEEDAISSST